MNITYFFEHVLIQMEVWGICIKKVESLKCETNDGLGLTTSGFFCQIVWTKGKCTMAQADDIKVPVLRLIFSAFITPCTLMRFLV